MHRRVLLYSSLLLVCFILSATHAQEVDDGEDGGDDIEDDDGSFDDPATTTIVTSTTSSSANSSATSTASSPAASTTKKFETFGSRYGYSKDNKGSNGGYYDDSYERVGDGGKDPSVDGTDIGDFGPVYGRKKMLSSLDVWIYDVDDWEQKGSQYKNKPSGSYKKKNNKDKNYKDKNYKDKNYKDENYKGENYKDKNYKGENYKDKNYKDKNYKDKNYKDKNYKDKNYMEKGYKNNDYKGSRDKRSYEKVHFPVKHIKNYRKFPTKRFSPLISIFPWVPIFYDKRTYQTIIFSPTGGLYIIPPLINFYGERFAVAQLIKWGYASLVSSGAPVAPGVDVAPLIQPPVVAGGVVAGGVAGGVVAGGVAGGAVFDANKSQFVGGVQTKFRKFKPRYPQTLEEDSSYDLPPEKPSYGSSKPNYGRDLDYGGTRDQTVYPQGGSPRSGGY